MGYNIFYFMMVIGFAGVTLHTPDLKMRIIGILLTLVNALLYYRGL